MTLQHIYLVILVENSERAFVFRFGSEFKIFNVLRDNLSVRDEKPLKEEKQSERLTNTSIQEQY